MQRVRQSTHFEQRAALCALLAALGGCTGPRTEVLVVVDTDLRVPEELDEVRIDLLGPGGEPRRAQGSVETAADLPKTLGIVDATNREMRSVHVTVTGLRRGANVVQRRAEFVFVPTETRILRIDLLRACVGVSCPAGQTCGEEGCRGVEVAAAELTPYAPAAVDRIDASIPADAGADAGGECASELCNERDDDCDGRVDESFALDSDPAHCGACDRVCPPTPENAASACLSGACALRCDTGFADCDGRIDTGCEAALSDPAHCGSCERACGGATPYCAAGALGFECVSECPALTTECDGACVDVSSDPLRCGSCTTRCTAPANARATCTASLCGFECDEGAANCDGDAMNGCESGLRELANCGRCGQRCERPNAVVSCASGACETLECEPLRGDCDGDAANGCESDVSSDVSRCGACDVACEPAASSTTSCEGGVCVRVCDPGFASCDGILETGCEQSLASQDACGSCGIACNEPTPLCAAVAGGFACAAACGNDTERCGTSCADTASDPLHCGACDMACPSGDNAKPVCSGGSCSMECNAGWEDCDGDRANGCEAHLASSARHCGGCERACDVRPYTVAECAAGACTYHCAVGWEDCNGRPEDGCEIHVAEDASNCGTCGTRCAATSSVRDVSCVLGACQVAACSTYRADCDRSYATGCEVDTQVSRLHCGTCGAECPGGQRCCGGACYAPADCP
jgi:hypothetical protein